MPIFHIHHGLQIPSGRVIQPFTNYVQVDDEKDVAFLREMATKYKACTEEQPEGQAPAPAADTPPESNAEDLSLVSGVNKTVLAKLTDAGITTKTALVEALKGRREEMQTLLGEDRVAKLLKSLDLQ